MYSTCWKFCHRMYKHTASKKQLYSIAQLKPISFTSQIHLQKRAHFWGIRFVHRGKDGFATAVIFCIPKFELTPYGNMNPFVEKTNQPHRSLWIENHIKLSSGHGTSWFPCFMKKPTVGPFRAEFTKSYRFKGTWCVTFWQLLLIHDTSHYNM